MKILYVGSFAATSFRASSKNYDNSHISGTVISLKNTLSSLRLLYPDFSIFILDTNLLRFNDNSLVKFIRYILFLIKYFFYAIYQVCRCDSVIFNSSPHGYFYLFPLIFVCIISRKNYSLRCFGGRYIFDVPLIFQFFNRISILCAKVVFLQTKKLCSSLHSEFPKSNIVWLPTARPAPKTSLLKTERSITSGFSNNYVYIGHIREDKGISYLIDAFKNYLPQAFSLHLYGPIWAELESTRAYDLHPLISDAPNITYKGVIDPEEVLSTLTNYDCLVFPSISVAEGYPGIVIEALSIGMPVLASRWNSLVEILDSSNSLLFEPKSSPSLAQAILSYSSSKTLRRNLHFGSLKSSYRFNLDQQTRSIISSL